MYGNCVRGGPLTECVKQYIDCQQMYCYDTGYEAGGQITMGNAPSRTRPSTGPAQSESPTTKPDGPVGRIQLRTYGAGQR